MVDVARVAGVSMKTVSNVINDFAHVSTTTRTKVEAAIEQLGYRPNISARNLARGRAGMIALVVPQLDMPYFAALSMQLLGAAAEEQWVVMIQQTMGDLRAERAALQVPFDQRIDGLIMSPTRLTPADLRDRAHRGPLVLLGERHYRGIADHVGIDNVAASRAAVDHLVGLGRCRIAVVGPTPTARSHQRLIGYRQALTAHGLATPDALVLPAPSNRGEDGEAAMDTFLQTSPRPAVDAVFCGTDWLALGVIRSLQRHGIRVPQDVAVVGFDDIPYGRTATPTLTTISPDRAEVARLAVDSLVRQRAAADAGRDHEPRSLEVPFRLVVRESTVGPDRSGER